MEECIAEFLAALVMAFIQAFVVYIIWPWTMIEVFHLPEISYVKAYWLVMLSWALSPPNVRSRDK